MSERVFITGIGMITAIGDNVAGNLQNLRLQRSGLGYSSYIDTIYKSVLPVAEVKQDNASLFAMAGIPETGGYTRTTLLGMVAMREALQHAGITDVQSAPTGFVNASTVGGMCDTEKWYFDIINPEKEGDFIQYIDTLDCADCTQRIADIVGFSEHIATISTACSSSANALMFGARMIKQGLLPRMVCGGTEALTRFTLNGFNSLKNIDKQFCRPFDQQRTGLNLGEGAAYLVLEGETFARANNSRILGELSGYCNTNEAFHPTSPSPDGDGAYEAMKTALAMSGRTLDEVQYINVHGTATLNNDVSEGKALERLFGTEVPLFSSTKPFTGHTLAAAGAIEAIYSLLAIQHNLVFPNLHFSERMEELSITPVTELMEGQSVNNVISNSFGFGGNNASLVISKYEG
ncbi:beta-ketoacyl-[acyl-carrier-protein] synthase family protein [Chitinophaga nivalis]|uniref:Beta-ketoacyl-[acyl-carrier-protein] synthase family protein n=1 Tax=Chitinophaga nivalis TaxID=2991709 RepID=A0ABT3ISG8_9BACT|nr:beta-ketoacyl-[acyl-carrier-protein] synthase family protein [Chitinophaga nivalis]MCW3463397.1 beta-ketoacyl-[acyl-carrier-protein] synthase family protein [Chitinophaga nivalis]MCW3486913.1 beta-ketoacyl-[acyl-carrier-protein] synthase family protein [Chitinophaga nivalis]